MSILRISKSQILDDSDLEASGTKFGVEKDWAERRD
tara:strand:+ start:5920 stop:6027 length:108 start_codon:yes stop_codon:yes gene_type:complete